MIRNVCLVIACVSILWTVMEIPAHADCKEEIQEVRDDIDRNKDNYTKKAIAEARKHLVQAEIPSLKLADCQRELAAAKRALRQGKK